MVANALTMAGPDSGGLITHDAASLRFGGFRFDGASDPPPATTFTAPSAIAPGDFLIDLRAASEAGPKRSGARRHDVADFGPDGPLSCARPTCRAGAPVGPGMRPNGFRDIGTGRPGFPLLETDPRD